MFYCKDNNKQIGVCGLHPWSLNLRHGNCHLLLNGARKQEWFDNSLEYSVFLILKKVHRALSA